MIRDDLTFENHFQKKLSLRWIVCESYVGKLLDENQKGKRKRKGECMDELETEWKPRNAMEIDASTIFGVGL